MEIRKWKFWRWVESDQNSILYKNMQLNKKSEQKKSSEWQKKLAGSFGNGLFSTNNEMIWIIREEISIAEGRLRMTTQNGGDDFAAVVAQLEER